ncbi:MAG TPA: hypothetical protein VGG39_19985 [Polyangiaceae bacterium]|jgi:hypothetical protein
MRLLLVALLPLVPVLAGCAGTVGGNADGVDAEATATTSAVVEVERTTGAAEGSRAEASARFVRVTAPSSVNDALRVIGASVDLPARGTCATIASLGDTAMAPASLVELLDVGEVTLQADGAETRLSARQLPDVTDVVSGVVYSRAAEPSLLPAGTTYAVHVAGGRGLEPIDATAVAPGDPDDVRITGEDVPGALIATGSTIELSWSTPSYAANDDVVYVDVRPNGVRCTMDGAGRGSVSTLFFDDAGTLVVHRLHRQALVARGVDSGEIRFDFARTVSYVRR